MEKLQLFSEFWETTLKKLMNSQQEQNVMLLMDVLNLSIKVLKQVIKIYLVQVV